MWPLWWDQLFLLLPKHSKGFGSCPKCAQQILTCAVRAAAPLQGTRGCSSDPHIWLVGLHLAERLWEQSKRNWGSGGCQLLNGHLLDFEFQTKEVRNMQICRQGHGLVFVEPACKIFFILCNLYKRIKEYQTSQRGIICRARNSACQSFMMFPFI